MFGMDWQSDDVVKRIHHNHDVINAWKGQRNPTGELSEQALAASHDLNQLLLPYIRARRVGEGSDFISRVWSEAPAEYPDMDEVDVIAICRELLLAGADTTMQALANAIYILLTAPELRDAIRNDPKTALNNFVEEALRLFPSAQSRFRLANQDFELAGAQVKKNDVLIAVNAAANRDPERHRCPATVDLARDKPTNHVTFNVGPRSCAGARLARAEMREVVRAVLTRLPDMCLDPDAPPPTLNGIYMKGYSPLHVKFSAAK